MAAHAPRARLSLNKESPCRAPHGRHSGTTGRDALRGLTPESYDSMPKDLMRNGCWRFRVIHPPLFTSTDPPCAGRAGHTDSLPSAPPASYWRFRGTRWPNESPTPRGQFQRSTRPGPDCSLTHLHARRPWGTGSTPLAVYVRDEMDDLITPFLALLLLRNWHFPPESRAF